MEPAIAFLDFCVRQIVEYPSDVQIDRTVQEDSVVFRLHVNEHDIGRVIGKKGVTIQAMRTLLRALGARNHARYELQINTQKEG